MIIYSKFVLEKNLYIFSYNNYPRISFIKFKLKIKLYAIKKANKPYIL
jgi:hypothetical protein